MNTYIILYRQWNLLVYYLSLSVNTTTCVHQALQRQKLSNRWVYSGPMGHCIIYSVAVHTCSTAISLKFKWIHIRSVCRYVLSLAQAKLLTFTPSDLFPPAFCHSIPSLTHLCIVLLLLANRIRPQAEQAQAAVMAAPSDAHTDTGALRGDGLDGCTSLSEIANQDCLLERKKHLCACCI